MPQPSVNQFTGRHAEETVYSPEDEARDRQQAELLKGQIRLAEALAAAVVHDTEHWQGFRDWLAIKIRETNRQVHKMPLSPERKRLQAERLRGKLDAWIEIIEEGRQKGAPTSVARLRKLLRDLNDKILRRG